MNGFKYIRKHIMNKTVDKIADFFGISEQAVSMWEKEKKKIPKKRLEELSIITGIPKEYFLIKDVTECEQMEIKRYWIKKELQNMADEFNVDVKVLVESMLY